MPVAALVVLAAGCGAAGSQVSRPLDHAAHDDGPYQPTAGSR